MNQKSIPASTQSPNPIWWVDPWWEDVAYQTEYGLSLEQIRVLIDALKRLFTKEWTQAALDAGPPNVILSILYGGKGLWPFQNLMWLSGIASKVSSIPGVHRPLRDLMGQKTWGTLLELEVASWFVEQDWQVEFLKPSLECKTPDLRIQKNGISTAIECKRFGSEQWEEWSEDLSFTFMRQINEHAASSAPSIDVLFEPRLSDLVWEDKTLGNAIRNAFRDELAERFGVAVREATHSVPPRSVRIPGVGEVRLRPDIGGSGLHGIGGIEVSPQGKMRRIVRNGVLEAARQLDKLGPGAVVIKSDFTPPKDLVDVALRSLNRVDKSLLCSVAVVVIPGSLGSPAVIWQNPLLIEHPVSEVLVSAFTELLSKRGTGTRAPV